MRQKIWIINHYAIPPRLPGGTRHYEFAEQLVERGYMVTIWLSMFHHGMRQYIDKSLRRQIARELPCGLDLRWIWTPAYAGNDWRRVLNMLAFFCLLLCRGIFTPGPQTIIASSPHLLSGLAGWLLSRVKRSRFILEIRDLWPDGMVVTGVSENSLIYKILFRLAHFLYRRSNRIIVLTEGIRDALVRQGVEESKIVFLPNGVSTEFLQGGGDREKTRRRLGFGDKFVCLYSGAHGPNNALGTVIEAARYLRENDNIMFALLGDGPEKAKLQARARELRLPNIVFLDPVPKKEVLPFLHAADAMLLSMKNMPVSAAMRPNKIFDYLAAGRPVICAGHGETRRLVENLRVGVCARPEDPEDLANAIYLAYVNRRELTARAAKNGPAYVAEYASREKMTCLLEKVINESFEVMIMTVHPWNDPRIYYKQARSLARKYMVELHAPGEGKPCVRDGVRVVPLPRCKSPYLRPFNWWRLFWRGCRSRAEIIHVHDPELLPVGYLIKILRCKKLVYDVHEDFTAVLENKPWLPAPFRRILSRVLGGTEKWLARHTDALVLAEEYYHEFFTGFDVPVTGIYNYPLPDLGSLQEERDHDEVFTLVYAGGISRPRGAVQMVRSLALVNRRGVDCRLLLVGPVRPPGLREELIKMAREKGLAGKIEFTGVLPLEEVYKCYLSADLGVALLHPEKNYTCSLATKIFEYMSAGLPVLASDFPEWNKLIRECRCGLTVNPLDEYAIAAKIEEMLLAPGRREEMGKNGYRAFVERYNWRLEEIKLWSLYERLSGLEPEV